MYDDQFLTLQDRVPRFHINIPFTIGRNKYVLYYVYQIRDYLAA